MRIIVVSDTHRSYRAFRNIVEKHEQDANLFLFAGDGQREFEDIKDEFSHKSFIGVCGNCDFGSPEKASRIVMAGDTKIFLTHGNMYGVKAGADGILTAAKECNAKIAVFGHTHVAYTGYELGIYLLNPGSASQPRAGKPSYGIIDITKAGIVPFIVEL
jgi:putative phosphoesterase